MSSSAKTNFSPLYNVSLRSGNVNDDMVRTASLQGALPLLITDPSPTFKQHSGYVTLKTALPVDPQRADCLVYGVQVTPGSATASFPTSSSPRTRNASGIFNIHTEQGSTYDVWVVTVDKFGNPGSPTGANAFYAGRFTNAAGVVSSGVNV